MKGRLSISGSLDACQSNLCNTWPQSY